MTFTLEAVAEPLNVPPRVALTAVEDNPDLSIQTCVFYKDGVPLRFEAAVTGDTAFAYDYDAAFDVPLVYRADASELGSPIDFTEDWASLADWTGSGWSAGGGIASSTAPSAVIHRDVSSGNILTVSVTDPTNMKVELTDSSDNVVASVLVSPDGTVTLTGVTASKVTGSGSFTVSFAEGSVAVVGTGWDTSVVYSGDPTRVRLVAPALATSVAEFSAPAGSTNLQGIAFQSSGAFVVVDRSRARVLMFNSAGVFQSEFGTSGAGSGQMQAPLGVAVDAADAIWVVDSTNNKVLKFDSSGSFVAQYGTAGSGNGQFSAPRDIAFKSTGNFVVTDSGNNRVQEFNSSGVYQSQFAVAGGPFGVAIGASDDIIVTAFSPSVRRYNASGVLQDTFDAVSGLSDPRFVARDAAGNFHVTFPGGTVQVYDSAGVPIGQYAATVATGIEIPASGDVYVSTSAGKIKKFTTDGGTVDDIIVRVALDEPVEVTATDDAVTLELSGANAGAWMTNASTPDFSILIDKDECGENDYYITEDTRADTELEENSVSLKIEGSADELNVPLGPRRNEKWTLHVACKTEAARQGLIAVLANSSVILLRFMASQEYLGLADGFYAVGRVTTTRAEGPAVDPTAVVHMPLVPSRAPLYLPLAQWNWDTLAQTGLTWDDVNTVFDSWNAVYIGPN